MTCLVLSSIEFRLPPTNDPNHSYKHEVSDVVTTPIGTANDVGRKVLVQADGKIVVAGYSVGSNTGQDFAVVRYNLDGSLDTTFGGTGKVTTDLGSADEGGWSAALQSDGKIVVVGRRFNGTTDDIVLIRYNTNGTLDSSFGIGGRVIWQFSSNTVRRKIPCCRIRNLY